MQLIQTEILSNFDKSTNYTYLIIALDDTIWSSYTNAKLCLWNIQEFKNAIFNQFG